MRINVLLNAISLPRLLRQSSPGSLAGWVMRVCLFLLIIPLSFAPSGSVLDVQASHTTDDPSLVGHWEGPFDTPVVGIHAIVLRTGKVLLLSGKVNAKSGLLFTDGLPYEGPVPPTGSIEFEDVSAGTYGLRLVVQNDAEPPLLDQAALIVHVAERTGDVIVDDGDTGFVRHGDPDFWFEADIGYGNHIVWTYVNGDVVSNWIEWRPDLPACGVYSVSAFIPSQNATTQEARYEVYHTHSSGVMPADESPRIIVANQSAHFDEWVPLGAYLFEKGQGGYVRLTDATGEHPDSLRQLGFDAVRWQLENRCATGVFLPLIQR